MDYYLGQYLDEQDRFYWNAIRDEIHSIQQQLIEATEQERTLLLAHLNDLTAELFADCEVRF